MPLPPSGTSGPEPGTAAPRGAGRGTRSARAALAAYLLAPALLTLGPTPFAELHTFTRVLQEVAAVLTDGRADVSVREAEALANIVLFLPLGLLLALSWPRAYLTLLLVVAGAGSLAIELTQYAVLPDRVPALLDVAMNTAGAAAGLVLGSDARRLLRGTGPPSRPALSA